MLNKNLVSIANWRDDDNWVFLVETNSVPQENEHRKECFENTFPEYIYAGFYLGVSPSKYMLIFGQKKEPFKKFKIDIYKNAKKELSDKFKEYEDEIQIDIDKIISNKIREKEEIEKMIPLDRFSSKNQGK